MVAITESGGVTDAGDRAFLGHPRGLAYLAFTEAWERFSFYGMQSLLMLFMVQELLLPGHVENVAGMGAYRGLVESVYGPLSSQALAGLTFGFYAGGVYLTPLIGGWVADRWLGARKTVVIGVLLMTAGHAAMVLEQSFLLALLLLVLGSGALKGNIAAQVGQLYRPRDARSTRGFVIFSTSINIGAIFGPLVCGLLAQIYGWHVGFGLAGLLMLAALAVYVIGYRHLPDRDARAATATMTARGRVTGDAWRAMGLIAALLILTVLSYLGYDQMFIMGMVWMNQDVNLVTAWGTMPVAWVVSITSLGTVVASILLIALWRAQARRGREPSFSTKLGIGTLHYFVAAGLIALPSLFSEPGEIPLLWPIAAYLIGGIGFAWHWAPLLAAVARYAPSQYAARLMAAAYMVSFFTGNICGYVSTFYERMEPAQFWGLNALTGLAAALLFFTVGPALFRRLEVYSERNDPIQETTA